MTCKFDGGVCRVGPVRWWNVKLIWIETQRQRGWANREAVTEAAQPATPATLVGQRQSFDRLSSNQHQGTSPCRPIHQSLWQQHQGLQDRLLLHQLVSSSVLASRSHLSNSAMCVCVCVCVCGRSQYRPKAGKFVPEDIQPDLCTHIIFAFGWIKKGKISSLEANDETKDGKTGLYERIMDLKKVNPSLKILLAIGKSFFSLLKWCASISLVGWVDVATAEMSWGAGGRSLMTFSFPPWRHRGRCACLEAKSFEQCNGSEPSIGENPWKR